MNFGRIGDGEFVSEIVCLQIAGENWARASDAEGDFFGDAHQWNSGDGCGGIAA